MTCRSILDSFKSSKILLEGSRISARQQLLDRSANLIRKNLNSLAVEVDVVTVEFGMSSNRSVEINGRNFLHFDYLCGQRVASRDSLVGVFRVRIVSNT